MPRRKIIPTDLTLAVRLELLLRPDTNPTRYVPLENSIDYPFEPAAEAWSRVNAWWLADASWLAYSRDPAAVSAVFTRAGGLTSCELIANAGTACYVAHGPEFAIVAFRGTQPDDWHDL